MTTFTDQYWTRVDCTELHWSLLDFYFPSQFFLCPRRALCGTARLIFACCTSYALGGALCGTIQGCIMLFHGGGGGGIKLKSRCMYIRSNPAQVHNTNPEQDRAMENPPAEIKKHKRAREPPASNCVLEHSQPPPGPNWALEQPQISI